MNHDPIVEMYDIWERYNQVRIVGLKKQANKILDTFLECFKKQTHETQASFVDGICTELLDSLPDSNDDLYCGHCFCLGHNGTYVSDSPTRIQFPLFRDAVLPELIRRYSIGDYRAIRWIGQMASFFYSNQKFWKHTCEKINLPWEEAGMMFFLEKSYAIQKDQRTLRMIIQVCMNSFAYYCHEIPCGILCESKLMKQEIAETQNYLEQLEPSKRKNRWNERLLQYERIAACWDDYCTHMSCYDDFRHYMIVNKVEW